MVAADNITLAPVLAEVLAEIEDRRGEGAGIRAMRRRRADFPSEAAMLVAGAAMVPEARARVDRALTAYWSTVTSRELTWPTRAEVIIGSGFHAAVYAACRVRAGFPAPYVVEQAGPDRAGGVFRVSTAPSFLLNSEGRPAGPGLPADGGQLNYMPGGFMQPSMISGAEFPSNADMAWLIRVTLAQFAARVITGAEVTSYKETESSGEFALLSFRDRELYARRALDMRGLGPEKAAAKADGERIFTFSQLMALADSEFPFSGWENVAVIGDGDAARCAVEALTGIGPQLGMRTLELDGAPRIGWYGPKLPADNMAWRIGQRGRYMRLASYLPLVRENVVSYDDSEGDEQEDVFSYRADAYHDVTVYRERGKAARAGGSVYVNGRVYSHAVLCTGRANQRLDDPRLPFDAVVAGGRQLGVRLGSAGRIYAAGPVAGIRFDASEQDAQVTGIAANQAAMFRLGGRTAQLAVMLPAADS